MDKQAQAFKDGLDQGRAYHLVLEASDWILIKLEDTGMYSVLRNVESPAHFRRLEEAVCYLLMQIGRWED